MTARLLRPAGAILAATFAIVVLVPADHRELALFAWVLLVGGMILSGLVVALATLPMSTSRPLIECDAPLEIRPEALVAIERDIRRARTEDAARERLRERVLAILTARLAHSRGIDLDRDREAAARLLAGTASWTMLVGSNFSGRAGRPRRLGPDDLERVMEELEQL